MIKFRESEKIDKKNKRKKTALETQTRKKSVNV